MRSWIAIPLSLLITKASAQVAPVGNLSTYAYLTNTMRSAGPLIYTRADPGAYVLYNLDLSVYLTITLPAVEEPYTTASASYFSEDLFDTDGSTVEYLWSESYYDDATGESGTRTSIVRTDGTVIWSAEGLQATFSSAASQPLIFNAPSGTLMNLRDANLNWNLFSLPGTLPCIDCGTIGTGIAPHEGREGGILAFPNPTSASATVQYTIPSGANQAALVFFDPDGRMVKRIGVSTSGTKTITTQELAAGTYLFRLEANGRFIGAERLVVVK